MKKLPLLAVGAAALAVAGFSPAFAGDGRGHVSVGFFFGAPVAVEPPPVFGPRVAYAPAYYDDDGAYWAHRRWVAHKRWEAYRRWQAGENCDEDRGRHAYHGGWRRDDD